MEDNTACIKMVTYELEYRMIFYLQRLFFPNDNRKKIVDED